MTTKSYPQYIRSAQGKEELYHWPIDSTEMVNLANSPEYRQVREELHARLRALVSNSYSPGSDRNTFLHWQNRVVHSYQTVLEFPRLVPLSTFGSSHRERTNVFPPEGICRISKTVRTGHLPFGKPPLQLTGMKFLL